MRPLNQGVSCQPVGSTPLGVADLNLHSFLANSQTFKNARVSNYHLKFCIKQFQIHFSKRDVTQSEGCQFLLHLWTKVGGGLAPQIYQLLDEDADVRPLEGVVFMCFHSRSCVCFPPTLEGNMYMEAALLGETMVNDTKVGNLGIVDVKACSFWKSGLGGQLSWPFRQWAGEGFKERWMTWIDLALER